MNNLRRNILGGLFGGGSVIAAFLGAGEIWDFLYTRQAIKGEVYRRAEVMTAAVVEEAESLAKTVEISYYKIIPRLGMAGGLGCLAYKLTKGNNIHS